MALNRNMHEMEAQCHADGERSISLHDYAYIASTGIDVYKHNNMEKKWAVS